MHPAPPMSSTRFVSALVFASLSLSPFVHAQELRGEPSMRLVLLRDGHRSIVKRGDLSTLGETEQAKIAASVGVDLAAPDNPLLHAKLADDKLYLLFYKTLEHAFADRPYVIQRIRKTERSWKTKNSEPTERVTYQVEVFKLLGGAVKRPDQHFGRYGLGDDYRREIVKEYEFGFGVVPGKCEGTDWPFDPRKLFHYLQPYDEQVGVYDEVKLVRPVKWRLEASFDRDGDWRVRSPELGFDAPKKMPKLESCEPEPMPKSKGVVLVVGEGLQGLRSLEQDGGEELVRTTFTNGRSALTTDRGVMFHLDTSGRPYRIGTLPGFLGETEKGLKHGDSRERVAEVMGAPKQAKDAWMWRYPGVQLRFDGLDRVDRIWVDVDTE